MRMENPTASKISYRFSIGIVKSAGCYYPFCVLFVSIYSWKFIIIIVVMILFFPLFFPIMLLWYSYVKFSLLMSNFNLILKIDKGWIGLLKPLHFFLSLFSFLIKKIGVQEWFLDLDFSWPFLVLKKDLFHLNFLVNNFLTISPPFIGCGKWVI